jgi:hypothetical protein
MNNVKVKINSDCQWMNANTGAKTHLLKRKIEMLAMELEDLRKDLQILKSQTRIKNT